MNHPISSIVGGTRKELADMTWGEYRAYPALNSSTISAAMIEGDVSMLNMLHVWDNGIADTDAMQFGRLVHCLLLEPKEVINRFRSWDGRRAGKEYAEVLNEANADGAEVVKANGPLSMEHAITCVLQVLENPKVKAIFTAGTAEQSVLCPERGLQCKGQLDWVSTSEHLLMDVKTTRNIGGRSFGKRFYDLHYDMQLGMYRRWLNAVTNDLWPVVVVAIQSSPPFDSLVIPIPDAVLDAGVDKSLRIIERTARAIETNSWPGMAGDDFYPLHVPYYQMIEDEENEPTVRFGDE